jgi:hypothetical protein
MKKIYTILEQLKKDIGEDLFVSLSDEDRDFILKTEGSIDFGHTVDLVKLQKILQDDENYYETY